MNYKVNKHQWWVGSQWVTEYQVIDPRTGVEIEQGFGHIPQKMGDPVATDEECIARALAEQARQKALWQGWEKEKEEVRDPWQRIR